MFALAIGAIVRNTAGGHRRVRRDLLRHPAAAEHPAVELEQRDPPYLPDAAGRSIFSLTHDAHSLSPAAGLALFVGYCALAIAIAAVLLVRRDT